MARFLKAALTLALALALVCEPAPASAQSVRGFPGSPDFGFGAILYPDGPNLKQALAAAVDLELDWVRVPVSWDDMQPQAGAVVRFDLLDPILDVTALHNLSVLISITEAPNWAKTSGAPDPEKTARFVAELLQRYPMGMQAVELFPGANTFQGWGSRPDPQAYVTLLRAVDAQVQIQGSQVKLVAGGLRPVGSRSADGDIGPAEFLRSLYRSGARGLMPVISMQFPEITGSPLDFPEPGGSPVLRHYEDVRRVMTENQHQSGLIWITQISLPSSTIGVRDLLYQDPDDQAAWLGQATVQLRAQLYIGVAFLQGLNPESEGAAALMPGLLAGAGEQHPFYGILKQMIGQNKTGSVISKPGVPKGGNFEKKRP